MQKFDKTDNDNLSYYNSKIYKVFEVDSVADLGLEEYKVTKTGKVRKVKSKRYFKVKSNHHL